MRIVVVFDNFGHYHRARLQALASQANLLAIEVAPKSRDHSWERSEDSLRRITLMEAGDSRAVHWNDLQSRLSDALRQFAPDAVAVPGWSSKGAFAAVAASQRLAIPLVVMSDSTFADAARFPWKERIKARYVEMFSAAFVAGSLSADYICALGAPPGRVFQGYDVVDNSHFGAGADAARSKSDELRRELGLPQRYFVACSRFVAGKNLDFLLRAYAEYRLQTSDPWSLVIVGDGPLLPELKALRSGLGLDECVCFPGFKQYHELPAFYGLAEAFVFPSLKETWGLVVNEAMAAGLAVIVSNRCGCVPDLLVEGKAGLVFDPIDQGRLSDCFLRLSSACGSAQAMGESARAHIQAWSPQRFVEGMLSAAECALQSGPKPPRLLDLPFVRLLSLL